MTAKPNDISQEAWEMADKALVGWHGTSVHVVCARLIMAARLQEREECAKVAEEERIAWQSAEYFGGFNDACNTVSKAIRARK